VDGVVCENLADGVTSERSSIGGGTSTLVPVMQTRPIPPKYCNRLLKCWI
jgi:hypothetical protein